MTYGSVRRPGFQEPATPAPLVFLSAVRSAYVGPSLRLAPHRNAVACVALGLEQPFKLSAGGPPYEARSALIPPNTLHQLMAGEGRMAFLYLDPVEGIAMGGPSWRQRSRSGVWLEHVDTPQVLGALTRHGVRPSDGRAVLATIGALVAASSARPERRVTSALRRLESVVEGLDSSECRLDEVASGLGLSPSRARHLIRDVTGVPFRRYRTWVRLRVAARALSQRASLTEAAYVAGFSSAAHFSTSFRVMFGLPPSALVSASTRFVVLQG
ncbi:AraC family transcriptional regulator [Myxococcus stipitatus]|uniref:helix-turn-helix transcriptional regulator n=1 Tax=Myxococcus stipitatus TaxID=83455 RepID=UPI0030CC6C40